MGPGPPRPRQEPSYVRAVEASKQEFWSMRASMASNMFFFSIVVRRNSASQLLHCFSWLLNQGKSMA